MDEAEGLRTWNGQGTVRVFDSVTIGHTDALLLEACEPGTALSQALPPLAQDIIAAGLLRRLWITPNPGQQFRPLRQMCDQWADEFEAQRVLVDPGAQVDPALATTGMDLLRALPSMAGDTKLLCTDFHPDNVLSAEREPWLVIDPKPYLGDPTYDVTQYMLNFPARLATHAHGFILRMAGLLDLNAERLQQWLFARCVQESLGQPHLRTLARELAP